jgi:hypothetical protein
MIRRAVHLGPGHQYTLNDQSQTVTPGPPDGLAVAPVRNARGNLPFGGVTGTGPGPDGTQHLASFSQTVRLLHPLLLRTQQPSATAFCAALPTCAAEGCSSRGRGRPEGRCLGRCVGNCKSHFKVGPRMHLTRTEVGRSIGRADWPK